jgi:hypothetical protein
MDCSLESEILQIGIGAGQNELSQFVLQFYDYFWQGLSMAAAVLSGLM